MLARALLLALTCLIAVACGGSSPTPSGSAKPSGSAPASAAASGSASSSGPTVNEAFCGTIADLESGLQSFEALKIKAGNASKLKDAAGAVTAAMTPITATATTNLKNLVAGLKAAVDGLHSSAENYATASGSAQGAAAAKIKKSLTTLHTAIKQLRQAATCSN